MTYGSFFFGTVAFLLLLAGGAWWVWRRWPGSPAGRPRLVNAALVLLAVLVPLAAAEGWLLFFVDTTDNGLLTLTSRRWLERHAPGMAFRGRTSPSADAGTGTRMFMAVLGDSITYGQGIDRDEDLYSSVLERELRRKGIPIDVYNLSMPGWNSGEELAELRRQFEAGAIFDAVVLGFCLNDIGEFVQASPGFIEAGKRLRNPPAILAPLVERSFVISLLYNQYVTFASRAIGRTWGRVAEAFRAPELFQPLAVQLARIKQLTDEYGAPLIVLTFPDLSGPWERYPYRDIHRKLDDFWRRLGAAHVDLLPAFERHPARSLHVGILDGHPNETAHRIAGVELAEALAAMVEPLPEGPGPIPGAGRP